MATLPRFYCPTPLQSQSELNLPASTARHVQVLRLQPGDAITLFHGGGGEFRATVVHMGRSEVRVLVGEQSLVERELAVRVHLWSGLTANERMDWLVEKATELGATSLLPIMAERSVLKLKGERADKKLAHWQAIAVSASEQCGRNRVLQIDAPMSLAQAIQSQGTPADSAQRWVLSLSEGAQTLAQAMRHLKAAHEATLPEVTLLSGPEGGLSPAEEAQALAAGFLPVSLGLRTLRAETAPVAVVSALAVL
jgi:16S rRNA (uracil1498-N3)-methyltransferase